MAVVLSAAKHLAFSAMYEDEILRLSPQDDIATQSGDWSNGVMGRERPARMNALAQCGVLCLPNIKCSVPKVGKRSRWPCRRHARASGGRPGIQESQRRLKQARVTH